MAEIASEKPPPKIIRVIESILIGALVTLATVSAGIVYLVKFICCR